MRRWHQCLSPFYSLQVSCDFHICTPVRSITVPLTVSISLVTFTLNCYSFCFECGGLKATSQFWIYSTWYVALQFRGGSKPMKNSNNVSFVFLWSTQCEYYLLYSMSSVLYFEYNFFFLRWVVGMALNKSIDSVLSGTCGRRCFFLLGYALLRYMFCKF